jgi:ABC-type uncharacterized transport system permease subunit
MDSVYGMVLAVILVFPWSLVAIMVGGACWGRVRALVRIRHHR